MSRHTVQIPAAYRHPLWFEDGEISYQDTLAVYEIAEIPFLLDILDKVGSVLYQIDDRQPYVSRLFERWGTEKVHISKAFSKRNRQEARPGMVAGLGWFISLIFWINGKKVERLTHLMEDMSGFPFQPVNLEERLTYILEQPEHYQSFIQLVQLYEELEKKWWKTKQKNSIWT